MTKSGKMIILSAVAAVLLALSCIVAFVPNGGSVEAKENWSEVNFEEVYSCNTQLAIPDCDVEVGGNRIKASSVVLYPDGSASGKSTVNLNISGKYTVRYTALYGSKTYVKDYSFAVKDGLVAVGQNSSVTYGKYTPSDASVAQYITREGLNVRLASGEKLEYLPIIDVNRLTSDEALVELYATPDTVTSADFSRIYITLTDAVDPDIYFTVACRQSPDMANASSSTYILAGANGQVRAGYEHWNGKLHKGGDYGFALNHSFTGEKSTESSPLDTRTIKISYNNATKTVYQGTQYIADFDDPTYFETLWTSGFPSGKAKLSISADMYSGSPTANFCIVSLFGASDLKNGRADDKDAPVVTVDTDYATMPQAKVGMDYPVPDASAFDYYSGVCEVSTLVYYNYSSSKAALVPIENGKFRVGRSGDYAIVYQAVDRAGLVGEAVLWVNASDNVTAPEIFVSNLNSSEILAGTVVELPDPVITAGKGSGRVSVAVTVTGNGKTVDVTDTLKFVPDAAGGYTVKYTATDYIGQTDTAQLNLSVKANPNPVFSDEPELPLYFIGGSTYTVPEYYVNDYSMGTLQRKLASVTVDGKEYKAGETFVAGGQDGTVSVTFGYGGKSILREVTMIEPFVIEGRPRLHIENYMVCEGVNLERNAENILVTNRGGINGKWTFANPVAAEGFNVTLNAIGRNSDFDGLKVTLYDSIDRSYKVEAILDNTSSNTKFTVNGTSISVTNGFNKNADFTVGYQNKCMTLGSSALAIDKTTDGRAFNGFHSDKIYFSVEFINATASSRYGVYSVNNQPINNNSTDSAPPRIVYKGSYGGTKAYGSDVVLPAAVIADVLDPNAFGLLTVNDPSGNPVKDVNGVELKNVDPTREYTVNLNMFGSYTVRYTLSDSTRFGSSDLQSGYILTVEDSEAPVITFAHGFADGAKVGDTLVIPSFTVNDNISDVDKIEVCKYVFTPSGVMVELPGSSNSIMASRAGVYELCVMATDEAGNVTVARHKLTVTE